MGKKIRGASQTKKVTQGKQGRNPDLARYVGNGAILPEALVELEQKQMLQRWKAVLKKALKDLPVRVASRVLGRRLRPAWRNYQLRMWVARRVHSKKLKPVLMQLPVSAAERDHRQRLRAVTTELKLVVEKRVHRQRLRPVLSHLKTTLYRRTHETQLRPVLGDLVAQISRRIHQERLRPILIALTTSIAVRVPSEDPTAEERSDVAEDATARGSRSLSVSADGVSAEVRLNGVGAAEAFNGVGAAEAFNGVGAAETHRTPAAERPVYEPVLEPENDTRDRSNTSRRTSDGPLAKADDAAVEKDGISGGGDIDAEVELLADGVGDKPMKPVGAAAGMSHTMLTSVVEYVMDALCRVVEFVRGAIGRVGSVLRRGVAAGLSVVARLI